MIRWLFASSLLTVCTPAWGQEKDFHDQDLTGKIFRQESLNKANFSGATLVECNFIETSLKKVNFKGANLRAAKFSDVDASEADFTGVTSPGQYIQFSKCKLDKANFEGVNRNLISLCFRYKCSLTGANLKKAKIGEISSECDLSRADLRGANLRGVLLVGSALPRFTGALYDDDTAFPDGFDPKAAGMILKEAEKEKKEDKK